MLLRKLYSPALFCSISHFTLQESIKSMSAYLVLYSLVYFACCNQWSPVMCAPSVNYTVRICKNTSNGKIHAMPHSDVDYWIIQSSPFPLIQLYSFSDRRRGVWDIYTWQPWYLQRPLNSLICLNREQPWRHPIAYYIRDVYIYIYIYIYIHTELGRLVIDYVIRFKKWSTCN